MYINKYSNTYGWLKCKHFLLPIVVKSLITWHGNSPLLILLVILSQALFWCLRRYCGWAFLISLTISIISYFKLNTIFFVATNIFWELFHYFFIFTVLLLISPKRFRRQILLKTFFIWNCYYRKPLATFLPFHVS